MVVAPRAIHFRVMADPVPLSDVARSLGVSTRTMWKYVDDYGLTKYQKPGKGKLVHLDPTEVRRKVKARPVKPKD